MSEKLLKKAIKKFGREKQIIKAIEEMSELQKELCKLLIYESQIPRDALLEEIADVSIMLDQLKIIFDPGPIEILRAIKLKKLKQRLK